MRSHTSTTGRFWGEFDVCNAGNLLKPMLGRGELRCIGATTLDEYRQHIEKDPALERRFQQVLVEQPSVPQTSASCAACASAMSCTTVCASLTQRSWRPQTSPTGAHPTNLLEPSRTFPAQGAVTLTALAPGCVLKLC